MRMFYRDIEPGVYNMTNKGSITTSQVTEWMIQEGLTDKEFSNFLNPKMTSCKSRKNTSLELCS